jgi:hypothetical protein
MPVLADKGYIGAGRGIHTPVKGRSRDLGADTRCRNQLICDLRALRERSNAMLKTWKRLGRVSLCPRRIGAITRACLVLTHMKYPSNYNWPVW